MDRRTRNSGTWRRRSVVVAAAALVFAALAGSAQPGGEEVPLEELLQIVVLERQLLAIDATGTGQAGIELEIGERVRWHDARGRIGVALTDERVLAVATGTGWVQARYRPTESRATGALLGDRVALVETSERMIGFTAAGGLLIEYRLGPREREPGHAAHRPAAAGVLGPDRLLGGAPPRAGGSTLMDRAVRYGPA